MGTENDHLDKETGLSVALTESGVEAKAKSRTIAAIDRLGGNLLERLNILLEPKISRERAKIEGEAKIISAAAERAIKLIGSDNEFAARALASEFGNAVRKQINKDAVIETALEDLRANPPTDSQAESDPEELSEEFLSRFDDYASGASSEQLRERWGRVLASEIRHPGNFSRAVLRVIDEIDPRTAGIFEEVCENRVRDMLLKPLTGELHFDVNKRLVEAGLVVESGLGHMNSFSATELQDGRPIWFMALGKMAVAFDRSKTVSSGRGGIISMNSGALSVPVYVLTSVGLAVSAILEDKSEQAAHRFVDKLRSEHPDVVIFARREGFSDFEVSEGEFPERTDTPAA
ncbi:DUF2806 domain-containing protein [Agrobacterium sp. rho-8.1]|nr:DUF2806 domain-containing protein [Agrobacterium sp. rho-8.1]